MSIPVTVGGIRRTEIWDEERERVFRESHIPSFDETDSISTAEEGDAGNDDSARAASHASYSSFTNAHRSPTSFRFPPPPFTSHYYPSEEEPTAVPTAAPAPTAPAPAPTTPTSITSTLTVPDQQAQQNNSAAAPFRESAV